MMKNLITLLLFVASITFSYAQECTTMWPYVYPDFKEGVLYLKDGSELKAQFNIHIQESRLHYLSDGIIKEALSDNVVLAKIGEDKYMCFEGKMMKVLGSEERGFVATLILGDFDQLFNSQGAYGGSSNSSAIMKLTSIEIGGKTIVNHMELRQNKENGQTVPLKYSYYIVTKGKVYKATKSYIKSQLNESEANDFKAFLKKNKIKWSDPQSLMTLLDFFNK